ncbi:hypothetical protein PUN4_540040 [Paraburkholderia unamae]|nr:hypothetical protein PUN4_540040 [Paraburkholderia unamae]
MFVIHITNEVDTKSSHSIHLISSDPRSQRTSRRH